MAGMGRVRRAAAASGEPAELRRVLRRLHDYARATGVQFEATARHAGWEALGLPDLRGFTPHLRAIRRFVGEPAEFPRAGESARGAIGFEDLDVPELWLLHDLAHVIWYDAACTTFGAGRWDERDFFLEQHLASEAFAVLLLDYHVLCRTRHRGLAVDLDARRWAGSRARVRGLPGLDSFGMCRELVELYLSGESALFLDPLAAHGADAAAIVRWRDHEVRYAEKQRSYVFLWWDDLELAPPSNLRAVVADARIAEPVWLLLTTFTGDGDAAFAAHVARVAARRRGGENLFAGLPKYRRAPAEPDFRFTDVAAIEPERAAELLRSSLAPSAERLFLLWQLLALAPPASLSAGERAAVVKLSRSVQTPAPDARAWSDVREICLRILDASSWTTRRAALSAFFLP